MREIKLPKYILPLSSGKYHVKIRSKKYKKNYIVGTFHTIEEAVKERDKFIIENINDVLENYTPRGITRFRCKFRAFLTIEKKQFNIGTFDTIEEAVQYRIKFINGLK